ncbi:hypothetical protein, partial [Parapusillimonas granuli]|uniref:hypothetical protein n=1 Tax=Parapusillimonas granuli TaxID=380911 RepID=UPI001C844B6B
MSMSSVMCGFGWKRRGGAVKGRRPARYKDKSKWESRHPAGWRGPSCAGGACPRRRGKRMEIKGLPGLVLFFVVAGAHGLA